MISDRTFTEYECQVCQKRFDLGSAIQEASKDGLIHFDCAGSVDFSEGKNWAGFIVRVPCPHCGAEVECVLDCEVNEMEAYQIEDDGAESCIRYS